MSHEELVRQLVDMANRNAARMDEDDPKASFRIASAIISESDVAFGVWQDANEPNGVGLLCIKGHQWLAEIMHSGRSSDLRLGAVPCVSREQAIAAEQRFRNPKH